MISARFSIGSCVYTMFKTGQFDMIPAVIFGNTSIEERAGVLRKYGFADDLVVFQVQPLLVEMGGRRVLIDPGSVAETPCLVPILQEAGIDPASIDTVILTHAHFDHHRECVTSLGSPAFPNARYYMQRREWEYWSEGEPFDVFQAEHFRDLLLPLRDCFTLLDGDCAIIPGIEAIYTPGHSPGHMAVLIDKRVVHLGDAAICVGYADHPEWVASFDLWPEQVVESRRKVFQRIADENLLAIFSHHAPAGAGRIVSSDAAWQWVQG